MPGRSPASRVGEVVAVHVIPRPARQYRSGSAAGPHSAGRKQKNKKVNLNFPAAERARAFWIKVPGPGLNLSGWIFCIAMNLGKVVGTLVASQKVSSMDGLKLLLVKYLDSSGQETGGPGGGRGRRWRRGGGIRPHRHRQFRPGKQKPPITDPAMAVILAIVDSWEIGGDIVYKK